MAAPFVKALSRALALATLAACGLAEIQAATLTWDGDGNPANGAGGTGTWDTINTRFSNDGITPDKAWNNALGDAVIFSGMAGTVTLGEPISASGLTFQVGGYWIAGNTLTLTGAGLLSVSNGADSAAITSVLAGSVGFTKSGLGSLTLSGTNTFTGDIVLGAGSVVLTNDDQLGNTANDLRFDGGGVLFDGSADWNPASSRLFNIGAAGGAMGGMGNARKIVLDDAGQLSGSGTLTKTGANALRLTAANTGFTGNVILQGGVLELGDLGQPNALGTGAGQAITVHASTELAANRSAIKHAITIGSSGAILSGENGALTGWDSTFAGPISTGGNHFTFGLRDFAARGNARALRVTGPIAGSGNITVAGPDGGAAAGVLWLDNHNSGFTGNLAIGDRAVVRFNGLESRIPGFVLQDGGAVGFNFLNTAGAPTVGAPGLEVTYFNLGSNAGGNVYGRNDARETLVLTPGRVAAPRTDQTIRVPNSAAGTVPPVPVPGLGTGFLQNGALWKGLLNITAAGTYTFDLPSDDGALLFIDGRLVVNNDGEHGVPTVPGTAGNLGSVDLSSGYHSIQVKFGQGTGSGAVTLNYSGPDTGNTSILAGSQPNVFFKGSLPDSEIGALAVPSGTGTFEITVNSAASSLTIPPNSTFNLDSATISMLNVASVAPLTGNVTINARSGRLNLNGALTEAAPSAVTFGGPYLAMLGATSSYSGLTTVSGGQLLLDAPGGNSIPGNLSIAATNAAPVGNVVLARPNQIADTAVVTITSGILDLGNHAETVASLVLNGANARVTGTGVLTASSYDLRSGEIASPLAHAGGLSHSVGGSVVLSGNNSYTGPTSITAGSLVAAHANALGAAGAGHLTTVGASGSLLLTGGITVPESVSLTGRLINFGGINALSATPIVAGGARLTAAAGRLTLPAGVSLDGIAANANVTVDGAGEVVVPGSLSLGTGLLTKSGTGTLTFNQTLSAIPSNVNVTSGVLGFIGTQNLGAVTVPAGLAYKFYGDPGAGTTITAGAEASIIAGQSLDPIFLSRIAPDSTGTLLLTGDTASPVDLSGLGVSLGAADGRTVKITGSLVGNGGVYRFAGGTGTIEVTNALAAGAVSVGTRTYLSNTANAHSAVTVTTGGRLIFHTNSQLGDPESAVTLTHGGVLEMAQTSSAATSIFNQLGNPIRPSATRRIVISGTGGTIDVPAPAQGVTGLAITGADRLQSATPGATLTKTGLGSLFILEPQLFDGHLVVASSGDRVDIRSRGSLAHVASVTVEQSGLLVIDNQNSLGQRQWLGNQFMANDEDPFIDRVNDAAPMTLRGGRLVYRSRTANPPPPFNPNIVHPPDEFLGAVAIAAGQAELRVEVNGLNVALGLAALNRGASGGIVNVTTSVGTLGVPTGNNPRLLVSSINGVAPDAALAGGWLLLNSTHYLRYNAANGFLQASYADQGATAFSSSPASIHNLNATGTATLNAGNASLNALRFSAAGSQTLDFNSATQQLNVISGGILSDNQNQARTVGGMVDFGRLTAGGTGATTPQSLFLSANQGALNIGARVIDNPNDAAATVRVIKALDGTAQLHSTANSYSGGTSIYRGTLVATGSGTLGTGRVQVQGFSAVDLRAANAVSGSAIPSTEPVYVAIEGGEIFLNNSVAYAGTNDRFSIGPGATIAANANGASEGLASLTRVTTITGGGQVVLAPGAIVRAQNMLAQPELAGLLIQNLGTAADLYFSPAGASGLNDSATLTIGQGTPWKGLSSGRTGAAWNSGTLFAQGDFHLQGLARDNSMAALTLGGSDATGTYAIVNRAGSPIHAYVSGQVILDEDTGVSLPWDLAFVVTNGGLLQTNRSRSLGDPTLRPGSGIASVLVQAGGTLDPGNYVSSGVSAHQGAGTPLSPAYPYPLESPLNGAVTVELGGRLLLNDASGLGSSSAVVSMKTGSVLELASAATVFAGSNAGYITPGRFHFEPGVIFRYGASSINRFQQVVVDAAPQPVIEVFGGNVTLTNHTNPFLVAAPGNPAIAPENLVLGAGVILTNDSMDRQVSEGRGKLILGNGVTLAAVNQTYLSFQEGFEIQDGAVVNIGANRSIDGMARLGGIQFITPNGTILPTSGNFQFNMAEGTQLRFGAVNTWPDHVGVHLANAVTEFPSPGALDVQPANGHSLLINTDNFVEVVGPLTGQGAIIGNVPNGALGVGWAASADFTFAGAVKNANSRNPSLEKFGSTKMILTGASDSTGELRVQQGELSISASGSVGFGTVRAGKGATVILDNTMSPSSDRLVGSNLGGQGGTFRIIGNALTPVHEVVSTLLNGGAGSVSAGGTTYLNVESGAAETRLSAAVLERFDNVGGRQTTWVYRSPAAANRPGTYDADGAYTPHPANVFTGLFSATTTNFYSNFSLGISTTNLTAAFGSPVAPVRPDFLGDAILTGSGTGFMTQDSVDGLNNAFRLLAPSEYSATFSQNGNTNLNVRLTGTVAANGDTRFATLTMAPGAALNISGLSPLNTAPSRVHLNASGIFLQAGAPSSIAGTGDNLLQGTAGSALWLHGPGDLNLNAAVFAEAGLVKSGTGTVNLGPGAARLLRASLVIDGGMVNLAANNSFSIVRGNGLSANAFTGPNLVLNGGTLNLGGNSQMMGVLMSANPVPYGAAAGGTLTSAAPAVVSIQLGGTFSGQITGPITLDKFGNNTLLLTNQSTYAGHTVIRGGILHLRDEARLPNTPQLDLAYGTLRLDNGYLTRYNDRLNPAAVVNSRGGTIQLDGRAGEVVSQNISVYHLLEGRADFNVNAGASGAAIVAIGDFNRPANSRAVVSFNQNFGFVGAPGNDTTAIRYLLGNLNGAPVTLTNQIVAPWMIVNGDHFATYSATNGIGALGNTADGFATYDSADFTAASATQNVNDGASRTLSANRTIYSLRLAPGAGQDLTLDPGVTLTIASGGLITNADQSIDIGRDTAGTPQGTITSGAPDLFVWVNQNTTSFNTVVSGSINLVKSGPATLELRGNNTFTGVTEVLSGTLALNTAGANGTTTVAVPGDLIVRNAVVSETAPHQIRTTASVRLNGGSALHLRDAAGISETIHSLTLVRDGGSSSFQFPIVSRATQRFNSSLNLTAAAAITAFSNDPTVTPTISQNVGMVNFTGPAGVAQIIDVSGSYPGAATTFTPVGLLLHAGIGTVPAGVPEGGLVKTGTGQLVLGGNVPGTFGSPVTPTEVFNIQQGLVRVDEPGKLGDPHAITTVQNGAALLLNSGAAAGREVTGSLKLKTGSMLGVTDTNPLNPGGVIGIATASEASQSVVHVAGAANMLLADYFFRETRPLNLEVRGKLTGNGAVNLIGPSHFSGVGAGGTLTLSNPILPGNPGANDYSGTITVGTNAILVSQHAPLIGESTSTGNKLGQAAVVLNGGRLRVRDDFSTTNQSLSNQVGIYGNNVLLAADSFLDANRTNVSGSTNNTIEFGTLAVNAGSHALTVDSGNGYRVTFTGLDGPGHFVKGGAGVLNITSINASYSGDISIAGPKGLSVAPSGNLNLPAVASLNNLTVDGAHSAPAGAILNVADTLTVGDNAGQVTNGFGGATNGAISGAFSLGSSTNVTTNILRNHGVVGAFGGPGTVSAANSIRGTGFFISSGASLSLSGLLADDGATPTVFKVAGSSVVSLEGPSAVHTGGTEIQSGTLRVAPVGASVNPLGTAPIRTLAYAPSTATASIGGTLQFDGTSITHHGGITNQGTVRVSGGVTTVTGSVAGTGFSYVPGLLEGRLTSPSDFSSARSLNPGDSGIRTEPRMAQMNSATGDPLTGWSSNDTWVYTGEFYDADGRFSFAENVDDTAFLVIDGHVVIANGTFNQVTSSAYLVGQTGTTANQFGANSNLPDAIATPMVDFGPGNNGWHTFEVRFRNGTGNAGAVEGNGFFRNFGFGYHRDGATALDGSVYTRPIADPSADPNNPLDYQRALFRTFVGGKGNLQIDDGATLNIGAFTMTNSVVLDSDGNTATLRVLNSGTHEAVTLQLRDADPFNAGVAIGAIEVPAAATISVTSLSIDSGVLTKSGAGAVIVGGVGSTQALHGDLVIDAGSVTFGGQGTGDGEVAVNGGTFGLSGSVQGSVTVNDGLFIGNSTGPTTGAVGGRGTFAGGFVAPGGTSPGVLRFGDGVEFAGGGFQVTINGPEPGSGYDQLLVTNSVSLTTNAPLSISLGFDPVNGIDAFVILLNDTALDFVGGPGRFSVGGIPLGEGARFTVPGLFTQEFSISYVGGDGNDVVLSAVPEPAAATSIFLGGLALLARRRRKSA